MAEALDVTTLRDALEPEPGFRAYPPPRRKHMAELAIEQVLGAIARGAVPLGSWEFHCIAAAMVSLREGQYDQRCLLAFKGGFQGATAARRASASDLDGRGRLPRWGYVGPAVVRPVDRSAIRRRIV